MNRAKKFEIPTKKEVRNQNKRMYWLLQITTWALPGFCVLAFSTLSRSMINGIFRDPNCTLLIDSDNNLNDNFAHLPCCQQVNNSQKKHFCPCFLVFLSSPVSSINDTTTRLLNRRMEDFSDSSTLTTPNYLTFEIQPKFFLHVLLIVPTILAVLFSTYFLARYQYGIRLVDRKKNSLPKQRNSSSPPSTLTPTITETSVPTCPKQQGQQLKQHRSFKVTIFVTLFVVLKGVMIFILILNTASTTTSTSISTAKDGWNKEIQCYLLNPKKFFVVFKTLYYYYYYYYVNNNNYSLSSDGPFDSSRQAPELRKFTATINSSYISNPITNNNITLKSNLFKDIISSYCSPTSDGIKFIIDHHHHQIADPQQHLGLNSLNSRLVAFTYSSVVDNLDLTSFFSLSCGILTVIWLFNEQVIEVWTNVVSKICPFPFISKAFKNCLFHHTTITLRGRKRHEYFPFEYKSRHNKLLSSQTFKPEISMRFWQTTTTTKDIKYMELIQQRVSTDQEMSKKTSSTPFNREYEKEQILININKKIVPRLSYHQIQIYNEKTISVKTRETVSYPHIRSKTNGQSTNTKWASTSNTFAAPSWTREPQSFNLLKRAKNVKCQHRQVEDGNKSNLICTNQNRKIKILKFASMYEHNGCGNHSHLGTRKVKHNNLEICQATRYWHRFKSSKPTAKSHFAHNVNQNPKGLDRCFTNDPHKYSKHIDSLVHITYLKHTKNKLTMYDH